MSRHRPWREDHPDAVIVDRRSQWGNPFVVGVSPAELTVGLDWNVPPASLSTSTGLSRPHEQSSRRAQGAVVQWVADRAHAVECFRSWLEQQRHRDATALAAYLAPLVGRDLACWCPLDSACHADVLLKLAREMAS
jgi:hypothetical protein